jgi:hypothetical protein
MPLVKFEPATSASERQQICALYRAATGIGITLALGNINFVESVPLQKVSIVYVLGHYHAATCFCYCKHFTFFKNNI